ncbi:MAG: non-ribosomal peptide synthetase, partial [Nitrosomonadales bacterium]|nr:non-ribosomal peptide synthetase [Nitrosomonadales bacterium]
MTKTIASSKINYIPSPTSTLLGMMSNEKILDKFHEVCQIQPNSLAIRTGSIEYTYQSLNHFSDCLAVELLTRTNHTNKVVAIYGKRSAALIVTMFACLKAGFTFAVLGHAYPKERLKKMAAIITPSLIVGIETGQADLDDLFDTFEATPKLSVNLKTLEILSKQNIQLPACTSSANDIAYLLFTSGTTGLPKCIQTSHQPLVHFIAWYTRTFDVSSGRQFSMFSGLGHDPVLRDIFVPLSTGGTLHIPDNSIISNPIKMFDWIQSSKIEYMHVTPQLLRLICSGGKEKELPDLRYVFCGGDVLRASHSKELKTIASDASLVNFYGATETPQAMGYHVVDHHNPTDPIPIGVGISDVQLLVMTDDMQLAKQGEKGQIVIRTHFLSKGYLNDANATSSQFIKSPFTDDPDDRIYLTGDYGYFQEDGTIVGLGRIDDQVKIRGFRVELLEITTALESHPFIQNAIVLANKAPNGESRLAAYLISASGVDVSDEALELIKAAMAQKLPDFMIPSHFLWIDTIPLLPNGKLDREKLPSVEIEQDNNQQAEGIEGYLINEWKYILGTHHINPNKSFVELGGDSLSFIQASMVVEKAIGWLPVDWEK